MLKLAYVRDNDNPDAPSTVILEYLGHDSDSLTDWVPVATPLAGDKAGFFVMPELGDMVVAAFIDGDINQPIVIGALWDGTQTPPKGGFAERRFVSRTGHSITLSDGEDNGITLEDAHKNTIVMNEDGITITSKKDLNITVSGKTIFDTSGEATVTASTLKLNP